MANNIATFRQHLYIEPIPKACSSYQDFIDRGFPPTRKPLNQRWMPYVDPELLPVHLSSPPGFSEVLVVRSLVFCVVFCRTLFVLFLLANVLSDYLQFFLTPHYTYNFFFQFQNSKQLIIQSNLYVIVAIVENAFYQK